METSTTSFTVTTEFDTVNFAVPAAARIRTADEIRARIAAIECSADFLTAADRAEIEAFRPLLNTLSDVLITSDELCKHWRLTPTHLCNLRKLKKGAPFIKLPSGGIRYRISEILPLSFAGGADRSPSTVFVSC